MTTRVTEEYFGTIVDPITQGFIQIKRYTLKNRNNYRVRIMTLGATVLNIITPNSDGYFDDIVLGFDDVDSYLDLKKNPYFGATIGRVANRIGSGSFILGGELWPLTKNYKNTHTLHGGKIGFHHAVFEVTDINRKRCSIDMVHTSRPGADGFPGAVRLKVRYQLNTFNSLMIGYKAVVSHNTPVNLTHHSYFNLAGHAAGRGALFDHDLYIKAPKTLQLDEDYIATGAELPVDGTVLDMREMGNLGDRMMQRMSDLGEGFDDCYVLEDRGGKFDLVAKVIHKKSGRWMEVRTDQPTMQFYTANNLPSHGAMQKAIYGKGHLPYLRQSAFCMETQGYPNAVNIQDFPTVIIKPTEKYIHKVSYKFGALPWFGPVPKFY